jgi:excisionase family DNA binding protein
MSLKLLTPREVAELWQVHPDWVYDQVAAGKLPAIRLGRNIRFRQGDLERYLSGEAE